jgi:AraC-like DNA-binding protein
METSDRSHALALAIVVNSARTIEERLFRERFRAAWVIALDAGEDETALLLAINDEHAIVGANRNARVALSLDDASLQQGQGLWSIFEPSRLPLQRADRDDIAVSWRRRGGQGGWRGLITPPDLSAGAYFSSFHTNIHARPRAYLLTRVREPTSQRAPCGGLSAGARRRVLEHIRSNLDGSIQVEDLAMAAGLSVHHFARAFKQTIGVSPHRYLVQQRVERAAQLLGATDRSLSEIAAEVGFADQSHFSKNFNRVTGSTPNAFRRAQR